MRRDSLLFGSSAKQALLLHLQKISSNNGGVKIFMPAEMSFSFYACHTLNLFGSRFCWQKSLSKDLTLYICCNDRSSNTLMSTWNFSSALGELCSVVNIMEMLWWSVYGEWSKLNGGTIEDLMARLCFVYNGWMEFLGNFRLLYSCSYYFVFCHLKLVSLWLIFVKLWETNY
jgi:hypothetical protein